VLPGKRAELDEFGDYVVTKPDFGARGADVRIERRAVVTWTAPRTVLAEQFGGPFNPRLAQELVYTGPWPQSYRVATLFGHALWAIHIQASQARAPLPDRTAFHGQSVVSSGHGCRIGLAHDQAVVALAERAHTAFSHVPVLGVDILRDADTGELFVIELNSLGYSWHFTSESGLKFQRDFAFDLSSQFDGRRKAARVLAQICSEHAR
jgi:glutathione synthase/RimK-type ligase-like ATP-grasp enzyme